MLPAADHFKEEVILLLRILPPTENQTRVRFVMRHLPTTITYVFNSLALTNKSYLCSSPIKQCILFNQIINVNMYQINIQTTADDIILQRKW